MANRDAKSEFAGMKQVTARTGANVETLLGRVDLHLVLESCARAVAVDHERRKYQPLGSESLGAQYYGDIRTDGGVSGTRPRVREECLIGRRHVPTCGARRTPASSMASSVNLMEFFGVSG
jgi:hypothetical protein